MGLNGTQAEVGVRNMPAEKTQILLRVWAFSLYNETEEETCTELKLRWIFMARKAKKKMHKMPPLSFVDKLIYWTIFAVLCAAYLTLLFGPMHLRRVIAFSDETVAAAEDNASMWWLVIAWVTFFVITFSLWYQPYQDRKPIFGRRNFKYGPPAWPKVYPLFMKNKPAVWVSERKKKERKQTAILLLVIIFLNFIPVSLSLCGRDCLTYDGSIYQYNMFNRKVREFTPEDISNIEIETFRYHVGHYSKKLNYGVRMVFKTESGKKYIFDHREFRKDSNGDKYLWLETMLAVKSQFDPGIVHYDKVEELDRVIADKYFEQEEIRKLYQLFGQ